VLRKNYRFSVTFFVVFPDVFKIAGNFLLYLYNAKPQKTHTKNTFHCTWGIKLRVQILNHLIVFEVSTPLSTTNP